MLKTIKKSANKKLGGCAATYRSGVESVYSTCPSSCVLKPESERGSLGVGPEYLSAVLDGVPSGGVAWTYTHFGPEEIPLPEAGKTCVNISADSVEEALRAFEQGYPVVVVAPSSELAKVDRVGPGSIRIVRCPAEYSNTTCFNCGGDTPLCARPNRDYIIKFTAHGSSSKKIDIRSAVATSGTNAAAVSGGCYGNSGPVRLQWEKTKGETGRDAETLRAFVSGLPPGTKLRHHVVGDLGG